MRQGFRSVELGPEGKGGPRQRKGLGDKVEDLVGTGAVLGLGGSGWAWGGKGELVGTGKQGGTGSDPVGTREQGSAGRDMQDKGDLVGTCRDMENPVGTQRTRWDC